MDANLLIDHHPITSPDGPDGVVVRALLTIAGTVPANRQRAPLALSLVLDRSGSMGGHRLDAAKAASVRAAERLHPDDVVSVIAFDSDIDVIAPPARRDAQHQLVARLQQIDAGGSTNLSGGWLRGRQHMEQAQGMLGTLDGSSRRIVLLTDGHANHGERRQRSHRLWASVQNRRITWAGIGRNRFAGRMRAKFARDNNIDGQVNRATCRFGLLKNF